MINNDVYNRVDVSTLALCYNKQTIDYSLDWTKIWIHDGESKQDYRKWLLAFFHWAFDEKTTDIGPCYLYWACRYSDHLVDTDDPKVLIFLLRQTAYTNKSATLQSCLNICKEKECYVRHLLDAGGHPHKAGPINDLYVSRLAARASIYAFFHCLSPQGGRQDLRACTPRDIRDWIARLVWAQRFD